MRQWLRQDSSEVLTVKPDLNLQHLSYYQKCPQGDQGKANYESSFQHFQERIRSCGCVSSPCYMTYFLKCQSMTDHRFICPRTHYLGALVIRCCLELKGSRWGSTPPDWFTLEWRIKIPKGQSWSSFSSMMIGWMITYLFYLFIMKCICRPSCVQRLWVTYNIKTLKNKYIS